MHVKAALKAATELNATDELDTNELLQFIAVFKIVGTATPHELFEQFITTVFNYCIFHVTFPCHIFQRFMIKISNCNYSLISWQISLKLKLHTVLYVIFMPDA